MQSGGNTYIVGELFIDIRQNDVEHTRKTGEIRRVRKIYNIKIVAIIIQISLKLVGDAKCSGTMDPSGAPCKF